MTLPIAIDPRRSAMHRRTIHGLALAALFAISSEMARGDEQVVIVARVYPTPGREAELEARLLRLVKYVKQVEPNITYRLHRSAKEPTVFLYYEVYRSQAEYNQHSTQTIAAFRKEAGQAPEGIFSRPTEVEAYSLLAE
jgi:quinol monooxygenase YgiN